MSKNIAIKEGGISKTLTADKLKTNLVSGGTCLWVPEDETILGTKHISENGTYRASDDGYYGYSEVTVSGVGSVTGRDPQTGEETHVTKDPQTGELVETVVPTEIRVVTPPTNPYGVYMDGQTITKDGMVVKAYGANGDEMQTVPDGEITINPTTAVYDESTDIHESTSSLDGLSVVWNRDVYAYFESADGTRYKRVVNGDHVINYQNAIIPISLSNNDLPTTYTSYTYYPDGRVTVITYNLPSTRVTSYTYNGETKTVFYRIGPGGSSASISIPDASSEDIGSIAEAAKIVFEGEVTTIAGSRQTITASWPQPYTGKQLTDTFEILVAPGYTPNSGT